MNIYLLTQDLNRDYDTYDSCVVVAENEDAARMTYPSEYATHIKDGQWMGTTTSGREYEISGTEWVKASDIDQIKVTLIGIASENQPAGVVLASFNAG